MGRVVQYCVCVKKFLSSLHICWVRFKTIRCGLPCHIIISQKFTGIFAMSNIFLKIISIKTDTLSYNSNLLSLSILRKIFVDLKVQNYSLLKSMGDVKNVKFSSVRFLDVCVLCIRAALSTPPLLGPRKVQLLSRGKHLFSQFYSHSLFWIC